MRSGRRRLRVVAVVLAATTTTASCSSDPPDPADQNDPTNYDPLLGVDPTASVEPGELPTVGPTELSGLADEERGLDLGEEHVAGGNHTTLLEVRRPLPAPRGAPRPPADEEWVGVRATTCFESELDRQLEIGSYMFSAVSADAVSYPGTQPADPAWPVPQYPGYGRLAPGQCTSGWIAIPVPLGATVTSIVQSAVTADPVAEWTIPATAW